MHFIVFKKNIPFAWTYDKTILKLFLEQRNENYKAVRSNRDEIQRIFNRNGNESEQMIDFVILKSVSTGIEFKLFTTADELRTTEKLIQRLVNNKATLFNITNSIEKIEKYVKILVNLTDNFYNALYLIGFRPPEVLALFRPDEHQMFEIDDAIDASYEGGWLPPNEYNSYWNGENRKKFYSTNLLSDLYTKVLYSLEAFIKVLIKDLRR